MNPLAKELALATDLSLRAGRLVLSLQSHGLQVDHKSGHEPVTEADRAADRMIAAGLRAGFADDGLLSEESLDDGSRFSQRRVWMVDPIDGTHDFIRGEAGYAVMIGLLEDNRPILGVVYQPIIDRLYYAAKGAGAWVSEKGGPPHKLATSTVSDLSKIRMVASKSHRDGTIDRVRSALGIVDEVNIGSVGLKLGLIARGDRELYVNPSGHSKLWDVLGPEAILTEAGGKITDSSGATINYRGQEVRNLSGLVASNGILHAAVLEKLTPLLSTSR